MLDRVCCAPGYVCTMFHWVPCRLLCCMTLEDLVVRPCHGIYRGMTEIWAFSFKICLYPSSCFSFPSFLPPFFTPIPFSSLACMFANTFPLSFSIRIPPYICEKPFAFPPLQSALTTSPTHHLSLCVSPSYILPPPLSPTVSLSRSLYCLNMQSYISSPSPTHSCLCVNHAQPLLPSVLRLAPINQHLLSRSLVTLTACLAPALRPELKHKAVYFYIMSRIYAWISKRQTERVIFFLQKKKKKKLQLLGYLN